MLDDALKTLRQLGLEAEVVGPPMQLGRARADAKLRLQYGGQEVRYAAQIRRGLRQDMLDAVLLAMEPLGIEALLVTDYLTPPVAKILKAHHVAYVDLAGNTYLDRPPMLVWVAGQRPVKTQTAAPRAAAGRAFRASGLQVLLALLCNPGWADTPYRELARKAGVAHGTVGWVMAELAELGFVDEVGGKRRLLQREPLLQQWVEATLRTLRPKLLLGRYRADRPVAWETFDPLPYHLALGGEPAAARLTGFLRPEIITLYGQRADPRLILELGLRPDPTGIIEIRRRFWQFETDPPELAPLPLIYADLLASGDARCLETAKLLHERLLA